MKRVTGIGGIFFKSKDPERSRNWYRKHLGIENGKYGGTFEWRHAKDPDKKGFTAWSIFDEQATYTEPSTKEFMVNYRVDDLEALLKELRKEGVEVVGEIEDLSTVNSGGSWIRMVSRSNCGNPTMRNTIRSKVKRI